MKWKNINEKEAVIGTSFKNHLIINDPNSVVLLCCDFVQLFGKRKKLNFGANSVPKSLISKVYFAKMAISRIFFFSTENYYFKCS